MENKFLLTSFLIILTSSLVSSTTTTTSAQQSTYSTFIKTSCNSTTYPAACRKSLLPYASTIKTNPITLVTVALTATLESANATLSTITRLSEAKQITQWEAAVLKDCIEDVNNSIDEIQSSINEITGISTSGDNGFAISNAQTWTSAAITDESSCLDGFSDREIDLSVKKKIRNSIVDLARISSNALYLINHLSV